MFKNKLTVLITSTGVALLSYFMPFIFGQFISPFLILIGLSLVLNTRDLDKGLLIGSSGVLYWYALQMLSLAMDQGDNLIDISVTLPSSQLIYSISNFIACYVIGFSLNLGNRK